MNNKNTRIFKFPRREIQISEEVNNKRGGKDAEKQKEPPKAVSKAMGEAQERPVLAFLKDLQVEGGKEDDLNQPKDKRSPQQHGQNPSKPEEFMRMSEKGVLFDRKLTKIAMPDHYEKFKLVSKLENKLLNCLEKKKALIPMKKLVKADMLNDILNKKQRKIVTNCHTFVEKLEVEAQSLKKIDERTQNQKERVLQPRPKILQAENKYKLKLLPLRVPQYKEEKEQKNFFQAEQSSNFIFQQAEPEQFAFFDNQESSFDQGHRSQSQFISPFHPMAPPVANLFKNKTNKYIEKQGECSFFAEIDEYSYNDSLFKPKQVPQSNSKILPNPQKKLDVKRIKIPNLEQVRHHNSHNEFNIFSIEEQASSFFAPEEEIPKKRSINPNRNNLPKQQRYWQSSQFSNSSPFSPDVYY